MIYAPIIIPTLNRYNHLKDCIESLKKNAWAHYTTVYISLDYPPNKKYEDGYKKIKNYLESGIEGFSDVVVIEQKKNLGPIENPLFLENYVLQKYDRYIFTEDDNLFSPNFIEYMDKNLEKYQDSSDVYAINGYAFPVKWKNHDGNIKQKSIFSAWGYGTWKDRCDSIKGFDTDDIKKYILKYKNVSKLCHNNKRLFVVAIETARKKHYLTINKDKKLVYIDLTISMYLHIQNKCVISPIISKVRNMGHDGTGVNCKKIDLYLKGLNNFTFPYEKQKIDYKEKYEDELCYDGDLEYERLIDEYYPENNISIIKAWIKWVLLKIKIGN